MLLLESAPAADAIMDWIDESVRSLQEGGLEPRFIVVGPLAYERLRAGVAARFGRENQHVEQVQWLTVVVDPSREDRVCVLPMPREAAEGVRLDIL